MKYLNEEESIAELTEKHEKLASLLGGYWGIDWTYDLQTLNQDCYVRVTLQYKIKGKNMQVSLISNGLNIALEGIYQLLKKSFEDDAKRNAPEPKETYTPTAYDMEQMTEYFTKHPAHYKEYFAKQINQSQPAFGMLTEEQRIRLCVLWKQYRQTINNE